MHLGKLLVASLPLLAVFACGGRSVTGIGNGDGGTGDDGPSSLCPPPVEVQTEGACTDPGLQCPSGYTTQDCSGGPGVPVDCICEHGAWLCAITETNCPPPPPPPVCPVASAVEPGYACATDPTISCLSGTTGQGCNGVPISIYCNCSSGTWSCPEPLPLCPVEASACPSPGDIFGGLNCTTPSGMICPGDPQSCEGQIDYDAFECRSGLWVDVAHTVCAVDGGSIDSGHTDSGWVDAGTSD